MTFTFETSYDQKALTAMAKGIRKTIRGKRSRRSHIFGWIVVILAVLLTLPSSGEAFTIGLREIITWLAALMIVTVTIFEDAINGYVAGKRMLPGTEKSIVTFHEDGYHSETNAGSSDFKYDNILMMAETNDYFIFIFSMSHAQVYDKNNLSGGTATDFSKFIADKTGKNVQRI